MAQWQAGELQVWHSLFGWKRRNEAAATLRHAERFLVPGAKVLDIGCGMGYALEVLSRDYRIEAFGCDVVPANIHVRNYCRFDGRNLPYADKSVDLALLIFVLHHAQDASILLREASRVARQAVLVVEDTPRNRLDRKWGEVHIRGFNKRYSIPWTGRIRMENEWRQLFRALEMPVRFYGRLSRFERLPPVARTAFVLQPARRTALREIATEPRYGTARRNRATDSASQ
ncbi:MAG: class I SAM-dependent methyltransferase [Gemmatimonadota bacterium]